MNEMKEQLFLLLCGMLLAAPFADAQQAGPTEYQVKAAFLYNFAKFVEWPSDSGDLQVCIIGDDPFGRNIEFVEGKTAGGKTLSVRRIRSVRDITNCRMLFISSSESRLLDDIVAAAQKSDILTVGDTAGYAQQGVVINLFMEQSKVRFEINKDAADRSGLNISSKLLGLARIVHDAREKGR